MIHHSELLNLIAKKIGAKVYIEIGVFNPDHNFNKIEVDRKMGVDPDPNAKATVCMTSDRFFDILKQTGGKACLVFIDGLHHADQVKKDILNAWDILDYGGVVCIHDSNPHSEHITHVPRDNREWSGDVYKTISQLEHPNKFTMNFDYGCCVIRKDGDPANFLSFSETPIDWQMFSDNREKLLNLVTVEQGIKEIEAWT
jgi:hypothetical protein